MQNSKERFTKTVEDYRRYRPLYPAKLIDWICQYASFRPGESILDLGSGTGISARLFAKRGFRITGVEPNDTMRNAAKIEGGDNIVYQKGSAEHLPCQGGSMSGVISGQAFHWFDLDKTFLALKRVLIPNATCFAFWNVRNSNISSFAVQYDEILQKYCKDYLKIPKHQKTVNAIQNHSVTRSIQQKTFSYYQVLDQKGFLGRVWSSSYVAHNIENKEIFDLSLEQLFEKHKQNGMITIPYQTIVTLFTVH